MGKKEIIIIIITIRWAAGAPSTHQPVPNVNDGNQQRRGQLSVLIACVAFLQTKEGITIIHILSPGALCRHDDPNDKASLTDSLARFLQNKTSEAQE